MRVKVCRGLGPVALAAVAVGLVCVAGCGGSSGATPDLATKVDQASPDMTLVADSGRDTIAARDTTSPDLTIPDQGRDQGALDTTTIDVAIAADLGVGDQLADVTPAMVPNFSLTDVNTTSTSHNTKVSPRDYVGKVAAFFFTTAT